MSSIFTVMASWNWRVRIQTMFLLFTSSSYHFVDLQKSITNIDDRQQVQIDNSCMIPPWPSNRQMQFCVCGEPKNRLWECLDSESALFSCSDFHSLSSFLPAMEGWWVFISSTVVVLPYQLFSPCSWSHRHTPQVEQCRLFIWVWFCSIAAWYVCVCVRSEET